MGGNFRESSSSSKAKGIDKTFHNQECSDTGQDIHGHHKSLVVGLKQKKLQHKAETHNAYTYRHPGDATLEKAKVFLSGGVGVRGAGIAVVLMWSVWFHFLRFKVNFDNAKICKI